MYSVRITHLIVAMFLAVAMAAQAQKILQETPQPPALTLQQCLDIALREQVDLHIGANSLTAAQQREIQAKSGYFPQAALRTDVFTESDSFATDGQTGTDLVVSQNIYDGGLRESRVKGARAGVAQNIFALTRTRQTVIYTVTRNYYTLLRARKLAGVRAAQVQYIEGQLALVNGRVQLGDAAEVDALPIESSLAEAQFELLDALNNVRTTAILLQQSMGLDPREDFSVQETLPGDVAASLLPLEQYLTMAEQARPDLRQSYSAITAAKANVTTAKIVMYPRPVATAELVQPVLSQRENNHFLKVGIEYEIFDGGNNRAIYTEALTNQCTAEERARQLAKDVSSEVQRAYLGVVNAQQRITASEVSLRVARRNFQAQDERYRQGLAIPLDLVNAQVDIVTAESNEVQAYYDYYTALAQLAYATGAQGPPCAP